MGVRLWGWDSVSGQWVPLAVDASGALVLVAG